MVRLKNRHAMLLLWAALLSQSLVAPVLSEATVEDQKSFFPPISFSPPAGGSGGSPPVSGSGGGHATPTPTPIPTPTPSQGTPSHGSSGSGHKSPTNCGSPRKGKKHHTSPSTPKGGGGGYHYSPPSSTPSPTPTTPISTPSPTTKTPPTTPVTPSTPGTTPAPPFSFGPVSPPFTCIFWKTHPALIWGLIGWIGTVGSPLTGGTLGGTFGVPNVPGAGASMNVLQALSSPRTDGYGDLYREGTAAFLNSMAHARFPFTTTQVRDSFIGALASNKAAADQARVFRNANEGRSS